MAAPPVGTVEAHTESDGEREEKLALHFLLGDFDDVLIGGKGHCTERLTVILHRTYEMSRLERHCVFDGGIPCMASSPNALRPRRNDPPPHQPPHNNKAALTPPSPLFFLSRAIVLAIHRFHLLFNRHITFAVIGER